MIKREIILPAAAAMMVVAVAVWRLWKRNFERRCNNHAKSILKKFAEDSATPVSKLWQVADSMVLEMNLALSSANPEPETTTLQNMLVSYNAPLPNGDEKGVYYGLNLRGTNFLMLRAQLAGKNESFCEFSRVEVSIPANLIAGTSQELFNCIAAEMAKFVSTHSANAIDATQKDKKIGCTISHSVDHEAESSIKWTSFSIDDPVGKNFVEELNQALRNHGVNMYITAMVDETIGDLAGGRYYTMDSIAAITLGMNTNAAYVKSAQAAPNVPYAFSEMVVNMNWGSFNSQHLPKTEFDANLDAESSNPGSQLISGRYLGEIVRRVLLKMAQETTLFGDVVPPKLSIPYLLKSYDMAAMHQDTSEDHEIIKQKLREVFEITDADQKALEMAMEICDLVAERAARLAGAGIVRILKKLGRIESKRSVVTVAGGLYEHYRVFRNYLNSSVWEMLGDDFSENVILEQSHGSFGAGALFLAACQSQNTTAAL